MGGKIMSHIREHALRNLVHTSSEIVILRACHRQEVEDEVVDEERADDDERRTLELLLAAE